MQESAGARRSRLALVTLLAVTGILHFVAPGPYERIIPRTFPDEWARPLVYASGAAELLGAAGLIDERTRRPTGWCLVALFVVLFPANVQMALDQPNVFTVARLPLQIPLVWWAFRQTRR